MTAYERPWAESCKATPTPRTLCKHDLSGEWFVRVCITELSWIGLKCTLCQKCANKLRPKETNTLCTRIIYTRNRPFYTFNIKLNSDENKGNEQCRLFIFLRTFPVQRFISRQNPQNEHSKESFTKARLAGTWTTLSCLSPHRTAFLQHLKGPNDGV
jgi:hypothetical protein